jgi:diguanylate cyclase (GGDEF)-like protein
VAADAHHECRFGQWYYSREPGRLRRHAGFAAIEVEHERMHRLAAELLLAATAGKPVALHEYDDFANTLERLRLEIHTLKREYEDSLYNHDSLTGAYGRNGMLTKLREMQELVKRRVQSCCIAMMDLDEFKTINDLHGHVAGDQVLAASAYYVMEHLRPYDNTFRYGGEEFLICLQNADLKHGHVLVERLREGLAALHIAVEGKEPVHVTASFGITLLDPDVAVEQTIDRADKALYAAKAAGRNCSRLWEASMQK